MTEEDPNPPDDRPTPDESPNRNLRYWLARMPFAMLVIAGILAWDSYAALRGIERRPTWRIYVQFILAAVCIVFALAGFRTDTIRIDSEEILCKCDLPVAIRRTTGDDEAGVEVAWNDRARLGDWIHTFATGTP